MPDSGSNETEVERRITRLETGFAAVSGDVGLLRERAHESASIVTRTVAVVETLDKALTPMIAMSSQVGQLRGELTGHQGECTTARHEDIEHRVAFETWVGAQFDKIRNRQLALHGTLLASLLSAMAVMAWYIVTHAAALAH